MPGASVAAKTERDHWGQPAGGYSGRWLEWTAVTVVAKHLFEKGEKGSGEVVVGEIVAIVH